MRLLTSKESGQDDSIQELNAVDEPPDSVDALGAMSDSAKTIRQDTLLDKYNKHRRDQEALTDQMHVVQTDTLGKHLSSTVMPSGPRIRHGNHSRSTSTSSLSHSPSPTTTESSIHSPITPYGTSPMPPASIAIDNANFSKRPVSPQSSGPSSLLSELLRSPPRSPNAETQDLPHFSGSATHAVSLEGQLEQLESSLLPTLKQPIVTRKPTTITFAVDETSSPRLTRRTSSQASTSPPSVTTLRPANLLDAAVDPPFDNRPLHVKFVAEDPESATVPHGKGHDDIKSPPHKSILLQQAPSQNSSRETSPPPKSILVKEGHSSQTHSRETSPPRSILIKEQTRPAPSRTPSREASPPPKSILIKEHSKPTSPQASSRETSPPSKSILIKEQINATPSLMSRTLSTSPVELEAPVKSILLKSPQPPPARIPEERTSPKPRKLSTLTFAVENASDSKAHFRGRSPPPTVNKLESTLAKEVAEQDEQDEMDEEQQAEDGTDDNNDEDDTDDRDEDDDENNETARGEAEEFDEDEADDNVADAEDDVDTAAQKDIDLEDLTIEDVATVEDDVDDDADNDDDAEDELEILNDEHDRGSSVDESDFVPGSLDEDLALIEAAKMLKPIRPQDIDPTFPAGDDDEDDQAVDDDSDQEVQVRRTSRTSSGRSSANPSRRGSRSTSKDAQAAKFQHTPPVFSKPAPIAARATAGTASEKAAKRATGALVRSKSLPQRRKRLPAATIANVDATGTAALKSVRPSLLVRTSTGGRRVASEGVRSRPVPISTVEQESAQKIKAVMSGEVTAPSGIPTGHQKKTVDSLFVLSI